MPIIQHFQNNSHILNYDLDNLKIIFIKNNDGEFIHTDCQFCYSLKNLKIKTECSFDFMYDDFCCFSDDAIKKNIKHKILAEKKQKALLINFSFIRGSFDKFVKSKDLILLKGL